MARRLLILLILINHVSEVKGAHAVNETCPPFWIKVTDRDREQIHCYKESVRLSYHDAIDTCINKKNASLHSPKYFPTPVYQKDTWLGLQWQVGPEKWYWTDGSPVELDWSSWNPWEHGHVGDGFQYKHCVYFDIRKKKWVPTWCSTHVGFYCDRTQCPIGWTFNPYTHRCVKVFPNKFTYTEAARSCDEHESIIEAFRSSNAYLWFKNVLVPDWTVDEHRNIWLGITDQPNPGTWVWHDGAVAQWTNFEFTAPQDFPLYKRNSNKSCAAAIATDDGTWVSKGCLNYAHTYRYVCAIHRCQFPFKKSVNGKCYARLAGGKNAFESSKKCGIVGGQLLTLEEKDPMWDDAKLPSKSEADFFFFNPNVAYGQVLTSAWLGLSDTYQQAVWQWNGREGRSPPISAWRDAGQPNSLDKDCAIVTSSGKFEAVNCKNTSVSTVICQRYEPYKMFGCRENVILGMSDYTHDMYSLHPQGVGRTCHVPVYDLKTHYAEAMRFCGRLGGHVMQIKTTTFMQQMEKWLTTQIAITGITRSDGRKRSAILPIVRPDKDQLEREQTYSRLGTFWVGMDTLGSGYKNRAQKVKWNDGTEPEARFLHDHVVQDSRNDSEHCFASDIHAVYDQNCFGHDYNFFCEVPLSPVVRQRKQFEWNAACQVAEQTWPGIYNTPIWPIYTTDGDVNGNTRTKSDDWFFDGGSCYYTPERNTPSPNIGKQADQEFAKSFCRTIGATLVIADSAKSTRGLQLSRRRGNRTGDWYRPWVGLQYIRLGVDKWKWLTARQVAIPRAPGDELNYLTENNWGSGQPDNLDSDFCVSMYDQDKWNNVPCNFKRAIVCQQKVVDTPEFEVSIVGLARQGGGDQEEGGYHQPSDALGIRPELINMAAIFWMFMVVTS